MFFKFIQTRDFLYENGIDMSLWKFYKAIVKVPGSNSALIALAMGDADFMLESDEMVYYLKVLNPGLAGELAFDHCGERRFARGAVVLNSKMLPEAVRRDIRSKAKEYIKNLEKISRNHPNLKALREYIKMIKARFVACGDDEFDADLELYRKAKKNGWLKEAEFVVEKMKDAPAGKAVEIKLDYGQCRDLCAKGKDQMACVEKCME